MHQLRSGSELTALQDAFTELVERLTVDSSTTMDI